MGHWNYRVVKTVHGDEDSYAIHEVHYDEAGEPRGMTVEPVTFCGDSVEDLIKGLMLATKDAQERGVFDPPASWAKS